jgi:hypothetical protein
MPQQLRAPVRICFGTCSGLLGWEPVRPFESDTTFEDKRQPQGGERAKTVPYLFAVLHADDPSQGGARFRLDRTDVVVFTRSQSFAFERTSDADGDKLTVGVPGKFVSRGHARILRAGQGWMVIDDGSRNGVFVNGDKVARAELADGDLVEIGHCFFRFRAGLPTPQGAGGDLTIAGAKKGLYTLVPSVEAEHRELARIARANVPVLLLGESGAGKEVVAQALHELSGRTGAFVPINCGAIPRGLVESQLFGHKKGSFSGATRDEPGFFRAADGGTIFLDELGDLPTDAQTTLLRVLEDRAVVPVGSTRGISVDVRVIAATHRALQKHVSEGIFRHDLFARLSGFVHALAPLRDRREDLGVMIAALLGELAPEGGISFGTDAALRLLGHPFPLNVRELRQCLASSLALAEGGVLHTVHLPGAITAQGATPEGDDLEARLVDLLTEHRGNVAAVARAMGKAPVQINRWMKRFAIDVNSFRDK